MKLTSLDRLVDGVDAVKRGELSPEEAYAKALDPKAASLAFTAGNDNETWPNQRMVLCPACGNKRCPKAEDPSYRCTGSNELGQVGELGNEADEPAPPLSTFGVGVLRPVPGWNPTVPVAASGQAPAGVVRIAGEELLEAIESEEDIVRSNQELLEGTPQTEQQLEQWRRLYGEIMNEANKRLRGRGVMLLVAVPNPNGLGAVFTGVDLPRFEAAKNGGLMVPGGEDYEVVLTLPARERVDLRRAGREEFVRKFIGVICDAVLEQKAQYEARRAMH